MKDDNDHYELDDGRDDGEWKSRYPRGAWIQIVIETFYTLLLLIGAVILLVDGALILSCFEQVSECAIPTPFGVSVTENVTNWIALAIAGMIGGCVFVLKWQYHSVAKGIWNQDRIIWRLIVPINSSMVSLFTGYLLASGVLPFLRNETFDDLYTLLGFGFVFGYFSDHILAAMQNLAQKLFGTLHSDDQANK